MRSVSSYLGRNFDTLKRSLRQFQDAMEPDDGEDRHIHFFSDFFPLVIVIYLSGAPARKLCLVSRFLWKYYKRQIRRETC